MTETTLRDQELAAQAGIIPSWGIFPAVLRAFATARNEERERCAKIAEDCIYMVGRQQAAAIARKIRNAD